MQSGELHDSIGKRFPSLLHQVEAIGNAIEHGLWHEATLMLLELTQNRVFCTEFGLQVNDAFMKVGATLMNPLSHASIVLRLATALSRDKALLLLNSHAKIQQNCTEQELEGAIALRCEIAILRLYSDGNVQLGKATMCESSALMEPRKARKGGSLFFIQVNRLRLELAWYCGEYLEAFQSGVQLHGHVNARWMVHIDSMKELWAKVAFAALLAPEVTNFGEILQQSYMMEALQDLYPWALELMACMENGDRFRALDIVSTSPSSVINAIQKEVLREKASLMSLVRYIHVSAKDQTTLELRVISVACSVTREDVEMLLLKALERGIIVGSINGRHGIFVLDRVQRKDLHQCDMKHLDEQMSRLMENVTNTKERLDQK